MSYFEFPNTRMYDSDLGWIIKAIKELIDKANDFDVNIKEYIDQWLDEHPEATTSIEDGAVSVEKLATDTQQMTGMLSKAIAHRGYRSEASGNPWSRDNSISAFIDAGVHGFKGFECDPRKDKDGVIVMSHDYNLSNVSTNSGNVDDVSYSDVWIKGTCGRETWQHLCTLSNAVEIAKAYNMFILFDMGKAAVTCAELAEELEDLEFYNYGVFNVLNSSELFSLPDYAIKFVGNDVFTHTEEELDGYITSLPNVKNLGVRVLYGGTTDEQLQLIRNKGYKIMANYSGVNYNSNTLEYAGYIDYIMGDGVATDYKLNYMQGIYNVESSVNVLDYIDQLPAEGFYVFQSLNTANNPTAANYMFEVFKVSQNYTLVIAHLFNQTASTSTLYKRMKVAGAWSDPWVRLV